MEDTLKIQTTQGLVDIDHILTLSYGILPLSRLYFVNEGREGTIYRLPNSPKVVKIFSNPVWKKTGIDHLLHLPNRLPKQLIFPQERVYFGSEFIGYVMDEVKVKDSFFIWLAKSQITESGLTTFRELIKLIEYIHQLGLVVGDFNEDNIFLDDTGKIVFIDTDGWHSPAHRGITHSPNHNHVDPYAKTKGSFDVTSDYFVLYSMLYSYLTKENPYFSRLQRSLTLEQQVQDKQTTLARPGLVRSGRIQKQFLIRSLPKKIKERFELVFHTHHRPPLDGVFLEQVKDYITSAKYNDYLQRAFNLERLPETKTVLIDKFNPAFLAPMRTQVLHAKNKAGYVFYEKETPNQTYLITLRSLQKIIVLELVKINRNGNTSIQNIGNIPANRAISLAAFAHHYVEIGSDLLFIGGDYLVLCDLSTGHTAYDKLIEFLEPSLLENKKYPSSKEITLLSDPSDPRAFFIGYKNHRIRKRLDL